MSCISVVINAQVEEKEDKYEFYHLNNRDNVKLIKSIFISNKDGKEALDEIHNAFRHNKKNLIVIGSIIAAQAYPNAIVGMTPTPGYERVPIEQKRMNPFKFIVF